MKLKVSDLTGAALEWATDQALGRADQPWGYARGVVNRDRNRDLSCMLVKHGIEVGPAAGHRTMGSVWCARRAGVTENEQAYSQGATPVVAVMRCIATYKLGTEVDVPDVIVQVAQQPEPKKPTPRP
jgi:hypothetical protein